MKLILASQSPRRRELIGLLNLPTVAKTAAVDEDAVRVTDLRANVVARAALKAAALHRSGVSAEEMVVGADTTVALDNAMLNKPRDATHARAMLQALRGREHEVHTGVVLLPANADHRVAFVDTALVRMRPYRDDELEAYIETGDPLDKAGGYAIQHASFRPVAALNGCYLNVMGLPVCRLIQQLRKLGITVRPDLVMLRAAHRQYAHCPVLGELATEGAL